MPDPIDKPFSPASERNREPILEVLRHTFADVRSVLEIGSGTGQHAVHFAAALPHLVWQASDRASYLPGIRQWFDEAALPNTPAPLALNVNDAWPDIQVDAIFTANTLHIMEWSEVQRFFDMLPKVLRNRRPADDLRPVQPRWPIHQRGQRALRRRTQTRQSAARHPRHRGGGPARRAGRPGTPGRPRHAGQQPLRDLASARFLEPHTRSEPVVHAE